MRTKSIPAIVAGSVFLLVASVAAAQIHSADDFIMRMSGEFEIGNGETHTIAHHKKDKEYRICVTKNRLTVPLKVVYDGKEQTVTPGNCADFEAMNIKIAPAAKLEKDAVIIGKFHRIKP